MRIKPFLSVLLDVAAGIVAIAVVLGCCMAFSGVGSNLRAVFALTGLLFFVAGLTRGQGLHNRLFARTLRVSLSGLLGVAALILNNGLHRLSVSVALFVCAVLASSSGIFARRSWPHKRRMSLGVSAGWLAVVALSTLIAVPRLSAYSAYEVQQPASRTFTLAAAGRTINPSELKGRVVVLAFWASWCTACFQELPEVQQVYQTFQSDPRVAFYFVDTGWGDETPERGRRALERHKLDLPVVFDSGSAAEALHVDALPAIVILDGSGVPRFTHRGSDASENLKQSLTRRIQDFIGSSGGKS